MQSEGTARTGRILVLGGSGTIGRAAVAELVARGYEVVCILRPRSGLTGDSGSAQSAGLGPGVEIRYASVTDPVALSNEGFIDQGFDAVVSCLASRTGEPADAWAIDYQANLNALNLAKKYGVTQMVMLSAICVQKPRLAFQHAKLAFEKALMDSGLTYSIVRPTAFFKSLSGQIKRVQQGKPFVVFGDGRQTACKPISDADLAAYLADCLDDVSLQNRILPIGGPGPAITPRQQGEFLFDLLDTRPHFKQVPVSIMSGVATCLGAMGKLLPSLKVKAELARIGYYYATESMLLLNPQTGQYDSAATPQTGTDTLFEYYQRVIEGSEIVERGDHAIF